MRIPEDDAQMSDQDCCGSGCNPCILDVRKKLTNQDDTDAKENALDQSNHVKFVIKDIAATAEEYLILILNLKDPAKKDTSVILKAGQYVILRISDVSRPFTPISWSSNCFTILVKIYKDGKMSRMIQAKGVEDVIDVRGPYGDFSYQPNSYKNIIMFSIGSGIAAMYPVINSIVHDDMEDTRISLNASFRTFSTVPFKQELRRLADYWNFSCTLFLTQEKNDNILSGIKLLNKSRLCENSIKATLQNAKVDSTLVLICGTKEFNEMAKLATERCSFAHCYVFE